MCIFVANTPVRTNEITLFQRKVLKTTAVAKISSAGNSATLALVPTFRRNGVVQGEKRAIAEIGYTRSTDTHYRVPLVHTVPQRLRTTSHWSKPHRIRTQPHVHRVHPIMAEQLLEMYPTRIQATRLWPAYSTTSPHAHMHAQRARTRATSRGGALFVPSSRSSFLELFLNLFPELFFCGP